LADFAPANIPKAKGFATEISIHNAREQRMQSGSQNSQEHVTNNETARKTTISRGIRSESLSPAEVAKKVECRPTSAEKKAIKIPMGRTNNER
jgi:DNA-damage-inducible protein D